MHVKSIIFKWKEINVIIFLNSRTLPICAELLGPAGHVPGERAGGTWQEPNQNGAGPDPHLPQASVCQGLVEVCSQNEALSRHVCGGTWASPSQWWQRLPDSQAGDRQAARRRPHPLDPLPSKESWGDG